MHYVVITFITLSLNHADEVAQDTQRLPHTRQHIVSGKESQIEFRHAPNKKAKLRIFFFPTIYAI